jgi:hypothetical protein
MMWDPVISHIHTVLSLLEVNEEECMLKNPQWIKQILNLRPSAWKAYGLCLDHQVPDNN